MIPIMTSQNSHVDITLVVYLSGEGCWILCQPHLLLLASSSSSSASLCCDHPSPLSVGSLILVFQAARRVVLLVCRDVSISSGPIDKTRHPRGQRRGGSGQRGQPFEHSFDQVGMYAFVCCPPLSVPGRLEQFQQLRPSPFELEAAIN